MNMVWKSIVTVGLFAAAVLVGAPPASAAADPYSGDNATDCRVSVPTAVAPGERLVIRVSVAANDGTGGTPTGTLNLAISARAGAGQATKARTIWTESVAYDGGTARVVGPMLDEGFTYTVTSRFGPADDAFASCSARLAFSVDSDSDNDNDGNGDDEGDDDNGGLLPDTGGPYLGWLLLGVGLVGGGAAVVIYVRRRATPATA